VLLPHVQLAGGGAVGVVALSFEEGPYMDEGAGGGWR